MSFMNDASLGRWAYKNVQPLNIKHLQPASLDLTWSGVYRLPERHTPTGWSEPIEAETLTLGHLSFALLGTTEHLVMPADQVGLLVGRSTPTRRGIIQMGTGIVEPGFQGNLTLEIFIVYPWPIMLQRGERLVQLLLAGLDQPPAIPYAEIGHYMHQTGATPPVEGNR